MRQLEDFPKLTDDLPLGPLVAGIQQNIAQLEKAENLKEMRFGVKTIAKSDYILGLKYLSKLLSPGSRGHSKAVALKRIAAEFEIFEIYGDREWGEVFMTSYYDPVIPGSRVKTKKFSQALYSVPKDLVTIRFDKFLETFPRLKNKMIAPHEQKSQGSVIRGRVIPHEGGVPLVVPFFSRKEIDNDAALAKRGLELAWVDPIKSFSLQIQGSGLVDLGKGKMMRVGYAGQNGHKYVPIGKFLLDTIPLEKMSMHAIESHLHSLPAAEAQEILNKNPSYVFFRKLKSKSITYFGTEVVAGRTIATDYRYFPKGAIGFLEFESPIFEGKSMQPSAWEPKARLVLDQDTGGAIRGAHRLDLYWGQGFEAERSAGVVRRHGRLYYLAPSEKLLVRLRKGVAQKLTSTLR